MIDQCLTQLVVDLVAAGFQAENQTAASDHRRKLLAFDVVLLHEIPNQLQTEGNLISDFLKLKQLLRLVLDPGLENLLISVVEGKLCAGRAGIDDELEIRHKTSSPYRQIAAQAIRE